MHTCLPPCRLLLPFDSRYQRSQPLNDSHKANVSLTHDYRTTVTNTRFLQTGQLCSYSYSAPIHVYLTTSINIQLTHGSHKTVANTKFHKKARLIRKSCQKRFLIGGPRATGGHRKYSCILEKFYKWSLLFKSAFLVSICYVIKYVIKHLLSKLINEPEVDFVMLYAS